MSKQKIKNKKFWEFKNIINEKADLYIYSEISSWEEDVSSDSFKKELDSLGDISTINLYINSPGGSVSEGLAIASMLKRHKAFTIANIDSMACSIASVIACACDKVVMPRNTMLMIHNALVGGFMYGNAKDFRKQADDLDKITESLRQTYLEKAGDKLTEEKLIELMDAETWLTAQDAFDIGLCDEILSAQQEYVACVDKDVMKNYINIPDDIRDLLEKEGNSLKVDNKTEEHDAIDHEAEVEETVEEVTETEEEIEAGVEVEEATDDNVEVESEVEDNSEAEVESENEVETYEAEPEPGAEVEVDQDIAEEEEHLQKKLNASNEKVIILNDKVQELENKIKELEEIENKYNELKDKMKEIETKDEVEEKFAFYKDKFAKFDALDKFKSDEVQNLIKDCVTNEKSLSKLNQMVVEMIDIDKHSRIVKPSISESSDKLEDLIPNQESGLSSLFE